MARPAKEYAGDKERRIKGREGRKERMSRGVREEFRRECEGY